MPKPWVVEDIGLLSQPGPGDANYLNGTFTINAGGADIWDNADAFHFVYQPLHGDGQITARVTALGKTDAWAKAGVMIREAIAPNAAHAYAMVTAEAGAELQFRTQTGGGSDHKVGPDAHAPYWMRLERKNSRFISSMSADGKAWTKVGDISIEMKADAFIGLAVTAHNSGAICTATLDHVSVQTSPP